MALILSAEERKLSHEIRFEVFPPALDAFEFFFSNVLSYVKCLVLCWRIASIIRVCLGMVRECRYESEAEISHSRVQGFVGEMLGEFIEGDESAVNNLDPLLAVAVQCA